MRFMEKTRFYEKSSAAAMMMGVDDNAIARIAIIAMDLARHLLETCRLRKENATGAALREAEWWEYRILQAMKVIERRPQIIWEEEVDSQSRNSERQASDQPREEQKIESVADIITPSKPCAVCGRTRPVTGGLRCENAHFVCADEECSKTGFFRDSPRTICPVCSRRLTTWQRPASGA
jgi:hypothetical protein